LVESAGVVAVSSRHDLGQRCASDPTLLDLAQGGAVLA